MKIYMSVYYMSTHTQHFTGQMSAYCLKLDSKSSIIDVVRDMPDGYFDEIVMNTANPEEADVRRLMRLLARDGVITTSSGTTFEREEMYLVPSIDPSIHRRLYKMLDSLQVSYI